MATPHNRDIRYAVELLLPDIRGTAQARNWLQHPDPYTHIAALGLTRIHDLLLPYVQDPRREFDSRTYPSIQLKENDQRTGYLMRVHRDNLSPSFLEALHQLPDIKWYPERVYVKYINEQWIILPDLPCSKTYSYNRDTSGKSSISIVSTNSPMYIKYLPCGIELHTRCVVNRLSEICLDIGYYTDILCDDFGNTKAVTTMDYAGECTRQLLCIIIE